MLLGVVLARHALAQLPPDNIFSEDVEMDRFIAQVNREIIRRGFDPYNRGAIPDSVLRSAESAAAFDQVARRRMIQDSIAYRMRAIAATRDASAQDVSAFYALPTSGPSTGPSLAEPPRARAPSGNYTVVGYGQAATGFNFRALTATGRIGPGGTTSTPDLASQVVAGFPANATDMFLTGIAADGTGATGYYRTTNPSATVPFVMNVPSGTPTTLPLAAGDLGATPTKMTPNGGFIAGTTFQTGTDPGVSNNNSRIARWTRTGTTYAITTVGGFPGAFRTVATGISANGAAIAGYYFDANFNTHPIRWTQVGGIQDLGALPGQTNGQAIGTNNDGSVVVGISGQAFSWTPADGMKALRSLAGSGVSTANAITPNGYFMAGASYDGGFTNGIAQLWTKSGETIKIRDLLFISGVDVTGWVFNSIDRIVASSDGTYTFLGNGTFNGVGSGFVFFWSRAAGPPPTISAQPQAQAAAAGGTAVFSVSATDATGYQWQRNGVNIAGATSATFTLPNIQSANAGNYTCIITNTDGLSTSAPAALTVAPTVSRLSNLSVRSTAGTGANTLIVGFTIAGGAKQTLLRGIGPTLGQFGVAGTLADPQLALFNSASVQTAQNDDWGGGAALSAAFGAVGAFPLTATTKDSALLSNLAAGGYSAQVSGVGGTTGVVLVEAYDSDAGSPAARYTNLSARNQVGTGANILIVGFNITGNAPKNLLIRGVGPTLAQFGVPGVLADPQLALFNSAATQINQNDDWGGGAVLAAAFTSVGAFGLPVASKDAALSVTLQAGSYTAQVSGVANTTGVALVEIYELP